MLPFRRRLYGICLIAASCLCVFWIQCRWEHHLCEGSSSKITIRHTSYHQRLTPTGGQIHRNISNLPTIYVITPTYARLAQKAELTRLAQTLQHVKHLHWIVVEDALHKTKLVESLLKRTGMPYTHLTCQTPRFKSNSSDNPRGTEQRNTGIAWLRAHLTLQDEGVVYFADDDNTYDRRIFEEMRYTKGVSCWPVGLVGGVLFESQIVENGKVVGFRSGWGENRSFAMDMAAFAVNTRLLLQRPAAKFDITAVQNQESSILTKLTTVDQLEPKAVNSTEILVWHTQTKRADVRVEERARKRMKALVKHPPPIPEV